MGEHSNKVMYPQLRSKDLLSWNQEPPQHLHFPKAKCPWMEPELYGEERGIAKQKQGNQRQKGQSTILGS
jgi:hypothetical protein